MSDDNIKHAKEASHVVTSYVQAFPNPAHPGQSHQYLEFHPSGHHNGSKGEGVRANRGDHDGGDVGMNHGCSCCHCVSCTSCWCRNDHAWWNTPIPHTHTHKQWQWVNKCCKNKREPNLKNKCQSKHSLKYSYFPRMQSVSACLPSPCTVVMRCPSRKRSTLERYEDGPLSTTTSFSTLNTHGPMWLKQISIKQHKDQVFLSAGHSPKRMLGQLSRFMTFRILCYLLSQHFTNEK